MSRVATVVIIILSLTYLCFGSVEQKAIDKWLYAVQQVESSGQLHPKPGDNGKSIGPLQIKYQYWKDAGIYGRYVDCNELGYAKQVSIAYMKRYAQEALKNGDFETLSRIHNGGPLGHKKKSTMKYWNKVKKYL